MNVDVIADATTFAAVADEWNALADRQATPLLRHEWFAAAFDAFGAGCELAIYIARDNRGLRAIAPFVIERGLVPRLALLGHQAFEPCGIVHDDAEALRAVLRRLQEQRLPVFMPRLACGSPELLAFRYRPWWRLGLPPRLRSYASVPLGPDWPAFEARMSKQSRTYIRRKRKAAEREGAVRVEMVAPAEAEVERHLADFIRVEGASWKGREGTALQCNARMRRFYTGYAKAAARRAMLRMFFLRFGPNTAAARLAVEHGGRLWELKIGYNERFSHCSPGILLTHETLHWGCDRGLLSHEFLGSAEPWQRWWPLELRSYQSLRLYPLSVAGCVAICQDAVRVGAQRVANPVRASIRNVLRRPRSDVQDAVKQTVPPIIAP
jgi:CelD/BcsL family acetyltransferase involved in cellulose biosynthesis